MDKLYAPWRGDYQKSQCAKDNKCVFCQFDETEDICEALILQRLKYNYVVLNKYPYNVGHIMIIPYKHVSRLDDLNPKERAEMMEAVNFYINFLEKHLNAEGFNVGMNLHGKAAGGSIPEHIHMHVIPRWQGDTGFLVTLCDTKPISKDISKMYKFLKEKLKEEL